MHLQKKETMKEGKKKKPRNNLSKFLDYQNKPINVSCEDNGIEMTVVAAEVNGEKTTILVSMHYKIAKRLDETTDLFDSYRDVYKRQDKMNSSFFPSHGRKAIPS